MAVLTRRRLAAKCRDCLGLEPTTRKGVGKDCGQDDCPLYPWQPFRSPRPKEGTGKVQALRAYCRWCLCLGPREYGYDCLVEECPFYPKMPWRGKDMPQGKEV